MHGLPRIALRFAKYLGAHESPDLQAHELDRSLQRLIVASGVTAVWVAEFLFRDRFGPPSALLLVFSATYLLLTIAYRSFLRAHPGRAGYLTYFFLILDPIAVIAVFVVDPQRLGFLNPFLLVIIVRSGLRYGLRTMYLSWAVTLLASPLLLSNTFWWVNQELMLALILLLLLVPSFFASLIRRIHSVRAIEQERARLSAIQEIVVARSSFLARVSHELRSPLQGIVSALDVLEMRSRRGEREHEEAIGRIRRSSLLLNTHLRDLLTLAKGEAGRLELHPEPFDPSELVESVASAAGELAAAKGLLLDVEAPPAGTLVVADAARIDQILTNLVVNSISYTAEGRVLLALRPYDESARTLRFDVADTGPGIDNSLLPTLLAPDRVVRGSERRGEGSGIGLAIVRTLVDHLGGDIRVTSRMNEGTRFTLTIPAEPATYDSSEDPFEGEIRRVLLVDDREDVLNALFSVVEELGFECDRGLSSIAGAALIASRPYDAIFLDVDMPAGGGIKLLEEARAGNGPNKYGRFVGMSASEPSEDVRTRFNAWLTKPIEYSMIRRLLLRDGNETRPSQPGLWPPESSSET